MSREECAGSTIPVLKLGRSLAPWADPSGLLVCPRHGTKLPYQHFWNLFQTRDFQDFRKQMKHLNFIFKSFWMNSFGISKIKPNQFQNYFRNKESEFSIPIFFWSQTKDLIHMFKFFFGNKTFGESNQIIFNPFKPFWKTPFRNTLLKSTQTFSFQILFRNQT